MYAITSSDRDSGGAEVVIIQDDRPKCGGQVLPTGRGVGNRQPLVL